MSWFSRKPKPPRPDPIGDLCRSLAEKPWEWSHHEHNEFPALIHISGVTILWEMDGEFQIYGNRTPYVWIGTDGNFVRHSGRDAIAIVAAITARSAALVTLRPVHFTESAKQLARAVLSPHFEDAAAYALADEVSEYARGDR